MAEGNGGTTKETDTTTTTIVKPGLGIVDTAITKAILPTLPIWHAAHFTPNALTSLGLISSASCVYFLYRRNVVAAIGFLIARLYFDYADGLLARKYNQTSAVGDWYDHVVDLSFAIGVTIVLTFSKYKTGTGNWCVDNLKHLSLGLLALFFALFVVQMGCIEKSYNDKRVAEDGKETTISRLRYMCPERLEHVLRCFDNGTLYIVTAVVFYLFCSAGKP